MQTGKMIARIQDPTSAAANLSHQRPGWHQSSRAAKYDRNSLQFPYDSALFSAISDIMCPLPTILVGDPVLLLFTEKSKIGKLTQRANVFSVFLEYSGCVRQNTFIILKHFKMYKSIFKCAALATQ